MAGRRTRWPDPPGDAENSRTEKPSEEGHFRSSRVYADRAALASQTAAAAQNGPVEPERVPLLVLIGAVIGLVAFAAAIVEERKTGPLAADKVVVIEREDDEGPIADQPERGRSSKARRCSRR